MRRTRARIERVLAEAQCSVSTVERVARASGLSLARATDDRILAALRWHRARLAARGCRVIGECGYCGSTERLVVDDGSVACAPGAGCARRRPEDEREARGARGAVTREYRARDGHWYRLQEIADLADITYAAAYQRMRAGWTADHAMRSERSTSATVAYRALAE